MADNSDILNAINSSNAKPLDNTDILEKINNPEGHGEFYKGVSSGVDALQGLGYGVAGLAGQALGIKPLQKFGAEGMQRNEQEAQQYTPKVGSIKDVHGVGDFANYLKYNTGNLLPSVIESLGAAAVGGVAGGPVGAVGNVLLKNKLKTYAEEALAKGVAKDVVESRVKKAAGAAGATAINAYLTGTGDIYQSTSDSGRKEGSVAGSIVGGVPYGALEYISDINLAKMVGLAGTKKVGDAAANELRSSLMKSTVTGGLKQAAIEGTTEAGQQGIVSAAMEMHDPASMSLDKALNDMLESGAAAFTGSLIPGMAGGAINNLRNRPAPTPAPISETKQQTTEQPQQLTDQRFNMPATMAEPTAGATAADIAAAERTADQSRAQQLQSTVGDYQNASTLLSNVGVTEVPKEAQVSDFKTFAKKFRKANKGATQSDIESGYIAEVQRATNVIGATYDAARGITQRTLPGIQEAPAGAMPQEQKIAEPFTYNRELLQRSLDLNPQQAPSETLPLFQQGAGIVVQKQTPAAITEQAPTTRTSQIILPSGAPSKQSEVIPVGGRPQKAGERLVPKQDTAKEAKSWYNQNREAAQNYPEGPYAYVKATNPATLDFIGAAKGELVTDMRDFNMSQKEKENAVQIRSTEKVSVREGTPSSEGIRKQNIKRTNEEPTAKSKTAVGNEKTKQVKAKEEKVKNKAKPVIAEVKEDLKQIKKQLKKEEAELQDEEAISEIDEAASIAQGIDESKGQRLVLFVASAKEFIRDAKSEIAKKDLQLALAYIPEAIDKQANRVVQTRANADQARTEQNKTKESEKQTTAKYEEAQKELQKPTKAKKEVKKELEQEYKEAIENADLEDDNYFSQVSVANKGTTKNLILTSLKDWFITAERAANVLTIANTINDMPATVVAAMVKEAKAKGINVNNIQAFVHKGRAYMIADRIEPGTERSVFMHEVGVHLGMTSAETTNAANKIKGWENAKEGSDEKNVYNAVMARLKTANEASDEELVAYAVEEAIKMGITPQAVMRMDSHKTRSPDTVAGLVKMFINAFMNGAKKLFNRQFGKPTAQDLIDFAYGTANLATENGAVKSESAPSVSPMADFQEKAMDRAAKLGIDGSQATMKQVLGWQTFNHIIKTYSNKLKGLVNLKRAVDQRTADIAKSAREAGDLDRTYAEWLNTSGKQKVTIDGKNITHDGKPLTQEYNFGALMGEATLENIMPGVDIENQKEYATKKDDAGWVKSYEKIQERWNKLDKQGKEIFTKAYQLHEKLFNQIVEAKTISILRTLTTADYREKMEAMMERGERPTLEWMKEQLTGTDEKEAPAGQAARKAFKSMMTEQNKQAAPYFHVGRFGDYFVRVYKHPADGYSVYEIKDGQRTLVKSFSPSLAGMREAQKLADEIRIEGKEVDTNIKAATEHFERTESPSMMDARKTQLQTQFKTSDGFEVTAGKIEPQDVEGLASQFFIKDMLSRIDSYQNMSAEDKDAAKAMIRQLYVQTLPETSSRRVFQHRQGIAGWDPSEMWRSQARRYEIATRQLGYALHDIDVQRAMESVKRDVVEMQRTDSKLAVKMQDVVDELATRERQARTTPDTPLVDAINRISFTMYLAASPSYTFLNLLQPSVITLPILGGKYGFVKTAKALARNTAVAIKIVRSLLKDNFFRPEMILDDEMINGKYKHFPFITGANREALQQLVEAGKIDLTQAHEIGHIAAGVSHGKMDKVRQFLGLFMHYSELINRTATGLTAFELAKERNESNPIASAMDMIDQTQFSYELSNRPRQMGKKGIFGSATPLIMQFQMYNVQSIELLLREMQKAFGRNATPEEVKAARKSVAGIFGTSAIVAGTLGVPAATMVMTIINAIRGDDDDEYDTKDAYRRWLTDMLGKDAAEMVAHGVLRPALGVDMSRAGLQDLIPFSRVLSDRREWKDKSQSLALDLMGPSMGWMGHAVEGYNKVSDGDIIGGAAMMLPRFASDIVKGVQVAENGFILDSYGNKIPVAVGAGDVVKTTLGFKPSKVAEQREALYVENTRKMLISKRKAELKKEFNRAKDANDQDAIDSVWENVAKFNDKNPTDRLNKSDVLKSYRQRLREYQGGIETGIPSTGKAKRKVGESYSSIYNF